MTTVVALAVDGAIYMAADRCVNVWDRPILDGARKILRLPAGDGEVLLGVSGSAGLPDMLSAGLKIDGQPEKAQDEQRWAHAVAVAVTELAKGADLFDEGRLEGALLLGWGGRVWSLNHATAIPHSDGRAAIGSGEGPAMGALDALLACQPATRMRPAEIVVTAARIAITRDRLSGGDIQLELLKP